MSLEHFVFSVLNAKKRTYGDYLIATLATPEESFRIAMSTAPFFFRPLFLFQWRLLIIRLHSLMQSVFCRDPDATFRISDTTVSITSSDCMVLVFYHRRVVGCGFSRIYSQYSYVYLHGASIAVAHQRKGLGKILIEERLIHSAMPYVCFLTRNPQTYYNMRKFCQTIYPAPEPFALSEGMISLVGHLADIYLFDFYPDRRVWLRDNRYLDYHHMPHTPDEELNTWFQDVIYLGKDTTTYTMLCIGTRSLFS